MNAQDLKNFEDKIASIYEEGKIKAPIHLSKGNEENLIELFDKEIKKGDWIFSTHRSHFHYLLAGGSPEKLEEKIIKGDSMHIYDKEIPFFTSAIVAGICPIAVGIALGIRMNKQNNKVWCFIGDMAFECGISHESIKYSVRNDLPITFIIENNNISVKAPTQEVWGMKRGENKIIEYIYHNDYPHHGTGKWVVF